MRLRRNAKIELLRRVPLFAACSNKELGLIATVVDELTQPEGTLLTEEGKRGAEFFVLVDGTATVTQGDATLTSLAPGDFFGEIALITDVPRTASVRTTSSVRVLVMTASAFRRLMRDTPSIQSKVLLALAQRLAPSTL